MAEKTPVPVIVFVSEHCQPCEVVKQHLSNGQFEVSNGKQVDMVDVETEEGFAKMVAMEGLVTGVPIAFDGKKQCRLDLDEEDGVLFIECPD